MKFIMYSIALLMIVTGVGCLITAANMTGGGLFAIMQSIGGLVFIWSGVGLGRYFE